MHFSVNFSVGCAGWYGTYDVFRRLLLKPGQTVDDLPMWKILLSGGIAGVGYWTLSYPFDVRAAD